MKTIHTGLKNMVGDAVFDKAGKYRYSLSRIWNAKGAKAAFVMLNPSKADATLNDPTITRCIGFAEKMGCGSLEVVNLFAYRTAYPKELRVCASPIGKLNDQYISAAVETANFVVVAWGNWGQLHGRDQEVLQLVASKSPVFCFGITGKGHPRHPLFLSYEVDLIELPR